MVDLGKVFILGDSYSTFEGHIPEGYATWYYEDVRNDTDVGKVEQTWWKKVLDNTKSELVLNCSYSGTTICHTGYSADCSKESFVGRFDDIVASGWFSNKTVDTFIIFGGTNDSWADSPIGETMSSGWTKDDLFSYIPAVNYLLKRVKELFQGVRLICILNCDLKPEINDGLCEAAARYGAELIEIKDIAKRSGHPDIKGMEQIAEQVLGYLKERG